MNNKPYTVDALTVAIKKQYNQMTLEIVDLKPKVDSFERQLKRVIGEYLESKAEGKEE